MMRSVLRGVGLMGLACSSVALATGAPLLTTMVELPAGEVRPLYLTKDSPLTPVAAFWLDTLPVTNQQFAQFVQQYPEWQPNKVPPLFAESQYLEH